MNVSIRFFVICAFWLLLQWTWRVSAFSAPEPTCPLSTPLTGGFLSLQDREDDEAQEASEKAVGLANIHHSSDMVKDLEDQVERLRRTVEELQKKLGHLMTLPPQQKSSLFDSPHAGDAQDLLFPVRHLQFSPKTYLVEMISLVRKRDEPFSMDVSVLTTDEEGMAMLHVLIARREDSSSIGREDSLKSDARTTKHVAISPLVFTFESGESFRVSPGKSSKHNCVIPAAMKGERVVLVGGSDGSLSVFSRSGSLKTKIFVTDEEGGILHLAHFGGITVFATRSCVGNVNPLALEPSVKMSCLGKTSGITSIALDARKPGRGAVALRDGQILYLDVKSWTLLHKFPAVLGGPVKIFFAKEKLLAATISSKTTDLSAERYKRNASSQSGVAIFDMTALERPDTFRGPPVHMLPLDMEVGAFYVLRRTGDTSILAVASVDGDVVEVFECLHRDQPALSDESWSHIRLPIMLLTILVAVAAQIYRTRKNAKPRDEGEDRSTTVDLDALWKERLQSERSAYLSEFRSFNDPSLCPNPVVNESVNSNL
ncbi:hypothetical protein Emag_005391 [Eimeria magna]